jgi:hypothetical protein
MSLESQNSSVSVVAAPRNSGMNFDSEQIFIFICYVKVRDIFTGDKVDGASG